VSCHALWLIFPQWLTPGRGTAALPRQSQLLRAETPISKYSSRTITTTLIKYCDIFLVNATLNLSAGRYPNGEILSETTENYSDVDFQATRYDYPTVSTLLSPTDAVNHVISSAGASKSRDHVDTRLIQELQSFGTVGELISDETVAPMNGAGPITGGTVRF